MVVERTLTHIEASSMRGLGRSGEEGSKGAIVLSKELASYHDWLEKSTTPSGWDEERIEDPRKGLGVADVD
jgi:hypothetical protein